MICVNDCNVELLCDFLQSTGDRLDNSLVYSVPAERFAKCLLAISQLATTLCGETSILVAGRPTLKSTRKRAIIESMINKLKASSTI